MARTTCIPPCIPSTACGTWWKHTWKWYVDVTCPFTSMEAVPTMTGLKRKSGTICYVSKGISPCPFVPSSICRGKYFSLATQISTYHLHSLQPVRKASSEPAPHQAILTLNGEYPICERSDNRIPTQGHRSTTSSAFYLKFYQRQLTSTCKTVNIQVTSEQEQINICINININIC